jgi:arylsulfatase A-like enzyme
VKPGTASFWKIYRLIFAIFSLYILGDAFNRWDGVRYYATFFEFLPSISLISILLSILAVFIVLIMWVTSEILQAVRLSIKLEQLFILLCFFMALSLLLYVDKFMFSNLYITKVVKLVLLALAFASSLVLTLKFSYKVELLIDRVNEHISPLVWMFGAFVLLSLPLVAYSTWGNKDGGPFSAQSNSPVELNNKRPNILLITFDAMSALDMSVYGYQRPTTPFIAQWAKNASLFSKVEAESNYTTPTTTSLMTSKRVWSHQTYFVEVGSGEAAKNNENLPYLLNKNGYTNIALQQIHRASVRKLGIADNFEIVLGPEKFSYSTNIYTYIDKFLYRFFGEKIILYDWIIKEDFILFKLLNRAMSDSSITSQPPENAFNRALDIIDNGLQEPFFAWIHIFAPHDPYLPPYPFKGMFDQSQDLRTWKSQMRGNKLKQIKLYRARYDEFIAYADRQLEYFMSEFKKRSAFANSIIILSADHGESFEHNYKGHGGPHLFEQVTNIPLIIKEPNQTEGRIIDNMVEQIDIAPTILELAGIPVPAWMEGRSVVPLLRGETLEPRPAFSMNLEANPGRNTIITKGTIAVWDGDYKLIHYLEEDRSLLFNLSNDPGETTNIFGAETETGKRLLRLIENKLSEANAKIRDSALQR